MAGVTFALNASKLKDDGSFTIPQDAVETLGLHLGDELTVQIEAIGISHTGEQDQGVSFVRNTDW